MYESFKHCLWARCKHNSWHHKWCMVINAKWLNVCRQIVRHRLWCWLPLRLYLSAQRSAAAYIRNSIKFFQNSTLGGKVSLNLIPFTGWRCRISRLQGKVEAKSFYKGWPILVLCSGVDGRLVFCLFFLFFFSRSERTTNSSSQLDDYILYSRNAPKNAIGLSVQVSVVKRRILIKQTWFTKAFKLTLYI